MLKIKELREELKLSQADVAISIGTSQRNIGRWENNENEPTLSFLIKLSNFFNVSLDFLCSREDDFGNYVAPANTFSDLSSEELAIIKKLRALDPRHRDLVKNQIETLAELSSQKTK